MNMLETIQKWLKTFPEHDRLASLQVDYFGAIPGNGSVAPTGLLELSRREDILGNVVVENQFNFALYYVFAKATDDDEGSMENADWLIHLQKWVQEQSILGLAPVFGDEPRKEQIKAQNGSIFDVTEEGVATYMVQLSVNFTKNYTR